MNIVILTVICKEARKKNVLNALGGGLIGTVISTAIISLIVISVDYGN